MTLALSPWLQRFAERTPLPVRVRGVLERGLNPAPLDAWVDRVAQRPYTPTLGFSTGFDGLTQVVCRQQPAVKAAYQVARESIGVSLTSVDNNLNGVEPSPSAALVRSSAEQAQALPAAARPVPRAGYVRRVLDGHSLAAREPRLLETRRWTAAPLPGKSLGVFDPARTLLAEVLPKGQAGELELRDRTLAPQGLPGGLIERGAHFPSRASPSRCAWSPGSLCAGSGAVPAGARRGRGASLGAAPTAAGPGHPDPGGRADAVSVDEPAAGAGAGARVSRAGLEALDGGEGAAASDRGVAMRDHHLGLATGRLVWLCLGGGGVQYARGGQGAAHGVERGDPEVSGYDLVHDLAPQSESLQARAEDGAVCRTVTACGMAAWLIAQAARLDLRRYRKHPRGPKKVPPKRVHAPSTPLGPLLDCSSRARSHAPPPEP